jgi:quercetin dioxygenase-like cupin family protein
MADRTMPEAEAIDLVDYVEYAVDSIVSKTLIDKKTGTLTLFAFDEGQALSEHSTPFDAIVQILDGEAELVIGGEVVRAVAGQVVIMPANVPHSVRAIQKFKMLLTMVRS